MRAIAEIVQESRQFSLLASPRVLVFVRDVAGGRAQAVEPRVMRFGTFDRSRCAAMRFSRSLTSIALTGPKTALQVRGFARSHLPVAQSLRTRMMRLGAAARSRMLGRFDGDGRFVWRLRYDQGLAVGQHVAIQRLIDHLLRQRSGPCRQAAPQWRACGSYSGRPRARPSDYPTAWPRTGHRPVCACSSRR